MILLAFMLRFSSYITTFDVSAGKLCIEVTPASKIAFISEELCIGCGICVKVFKNDFSLFQL